MACFAQLPPLDPKVSVVDEIDKSSEFVSTEDVHFTDGGLQHSFEHCNPLVKTTKWAT